MIEIQDITLEKYLRWYEELSTKIANLNSLPQPSLNDIDFEKTARNSFLSGVAGHQIDFDKLKAERDKKTEAQIDFQRLDLYRKAGYYIPTIENWEGFKYLRSSAIEENKAEFLKSFERSVMAESDFIKYKINEKSEDFLSDSGIYDCIKVGQPLVKTVLKAIVKNAGTDFIPNSEWISFCTWVSNFDYLKWLYQRLKATEPLIENSPEANQTVNGIALYYWYLREYKGPDLTDTKVLNDAIKMFQVSKKKLQIAFNRIGNGKEITIVDKNTNIRKAKLNDHRFAFATLKEQTNNQAAIKQAEQNLKLIELKIYGPL
jgi:hypothetical protein